MLKCVSIEFDKFDSQVLFDPPITNTKTRTKFPKLKFIFIEIHYHNKFKLANKTKRSNW